MRRTFLLDPARLDLLGAAIVSALFWPTERRGPPTPVRDGGRPRHGRHPRSRAYDVVIGDLLYTQPLYPALDDAAVGETEVADALHRYGNRLTEAVVRRLHASATPDGIVVHVHDLLGFWEGHSQPFALEDLLDDAADVPGVAAQMAAQGRQALGADPRRAFAVAGVEAVATAVWCWPFAPGVDYLVRATAARRASSEPPQPPRLPSRRTAHAS